MIPDNIKKKYKDELDKDHSMYHYYPCSFECDICEVCEFTCDLCDDNDICPWSWDLYNTSNDCLGMK